MLSIKKIKNEYLFQVYVSYINSDLIDQILQIALKAHISYKKIVRIRF